MKWWSVFLSFVVALPARADEPSSAVLPPPLRQVAVLDLETDGGDSAVIGQQLTARVAEVLGAQPGFKVMSSDDFRALLEQEAKKQAMGCADDGCLAEIAGALGADLVFRGRVTRAERGWLLSLSGLDARRARALGHVSETWLGESIGLLELVPPMVEKLLAAPEDRPRLVGALELEGALDGSRVLLDGRIRGTAPAGKMAEIPIGARRLEVVADGHLPFERSVVIHTGATTTVNVRQEPVPQAPVSGRWWFWTAIAAVAVTGAAAGAYFALSGDDDTPGAGTGVNISVNDTVLTGGR